MATVLKDQSASITSASKVFFGSLVLCRSLAKASSPLGKRSAMLCASEIKQHDTAVRRLVNKARVHGLSNPAVLGILSNVASASDTESLDGFEVVRASTDTSTRINMTMMVLTFVCGIMIGWIMRLLAPQHVEDDEPNVQSNNTTSVACDSSRVLMQV